MTAVGLRDRAATIISGDTLAERKPHPLPLLHAAELIRVVPNGCVYIGDAERDVQAGRAAGMRTLVAAFGYIGLFRGTLFIFALQGSYLDHED